MVAGLSLTPGVVCEDQSSTWASHPPNFTPLTSVVAASNTVEPRASSCRNRTRKHANSAQNEVQNTLNGHEDKGKRSSSSCSSTGAVKTRDAQSSHHWSVHANAQSAVASNSLMWNGANAAPSTTTQKSISSSHRAGCTQAKSAKTDVSVTSPSPMSAKQEGTFYQRITNWDVNNTCPSPSIAASTDASERAAVPADTVNTEPHKGSNCGFGSSSSSRHSSPTLSESATSKQSSYSPNPVSLEEETEGEEAVRLLHTVDAQPPTLPPTAPASSSSSPSTVSAAPLSFITPCASYTESPVSSVSPTPSSPPTTFTMTDIVAALRHTPEEQHPFLDMEYQRNAREHERVQEQLNQQVVQSYQNQFSGQQQAAAFKCLLNAAHRRQYSQCMSRDTAEAKTGKTTPSETAATVCDGGCAGARAPSGAGRWGPLQRRLVNRQWRMTAEQAECDLYREGLGVVQRKLSCMCLFNPDTDVRVYDENGNAREQRCHRQHKLLIRLQRQRVRGGNPYFLDVAH